jgi:uncharacterized membrane protein YfcA
VSLTVVDGVVVAGATLVAGAVNALAGGGTLVSFPTLVAVGVPALPANVTNTVALCPGYLSGTLAQRGDLGGQRRRLAWLTVTAGVGGLAGSALLEVTTNATFEKVVPWLLLLSCVLLLVQDRLRAWVATRAAGSGEEAGAPTTARPPLPLLLTVLAGSVYGGFFGAGLGIMLLAVLGLFLDESMVRVNAVKQVLQFVINILAAAFFAVSGHVRWELIPIMGVAGIVGGTAGGKLARVVNPTWLRRVVVLVGLGVAVDFWLTK